MLRRVLAALVGGPDRVPRASGSAAILLAGDHRFAEMLRVGAELTAPCSGAPERCPRLLLPVAGDRPWLFQFHG